MVGGEDTKQENKMSKSVLQNIDFSEQVFCRLLY